MGNLNCLELSEYQDSEEIYVQTDARSTNVAGLQSSKDIENETRKQNERELRKIAAEKRVAETNTISEYRTKQNLIGKIDMELKFHLVFARQVLILFENN